MSVSPPTRATVEKFRLWLFLLMLGGVAGGLVFSPPMLSVGLIGITVLGLLDPLAGVNPRWRAAVGGWLRHPVFWGIFLLAVILLLGVWQTEDWAYYRERLRVKSVLLWLPLAWCGLPELTDRLRGRVYAVFAVFMLLVLAGALVNYAFHFSEINDRISRGQPLPVPRNHIRFSLLVALAMLLSVGAFSLRAFGRRRTWLVVAGLLFAGLHVLAVRSGLAGAYLGAGAQVLAYGYRQGRYGVALAALVGLAALPVVAYVAVPSFRTKIQYARYELFHRNPAEDTGDYSDAGRLTSIRIGLSLFRENPVFGVGPGNLLRATDERYAELLPGIQGKRPHNQFVSILAGSGLVGGILALMAFGLLLVYGLRRRFPVYLSVWVVLTASCMVENTLENSAGVSLFCVFLLLTARYSSSLPQRITARSTGFM